MGFIARLTPTVSGTFHKYGVHQLSSSGLTTAVTLFNVYTNQRICQSSANYSQSNFIWERTNEGSEVNIERFELF